MNNSEFDDKQIKIFVSSTFSDLKDERNSITYKIFPEKRFFCEQRGYDLVDIDLRWGITAQESHNGNVLEICLSEILNTRPFFIGIVGDRYGWVPAKKDVCEIDNLVGTFPKLNDYLDSKCSITEMEMMFGVLDSPRTINAAFFIRQNHRTDNSEDGRRSEALRQKIRTQGKYPVYEYQTIEEFENLVDNYLNGRLEELCVDYLNEEPDYAVLHKKYRATLLMNYLPLEHQIEALDNFMGDADRRFIILKSDGGYGKSSLLAYYAGQLGRKNEEWCTVSFFCDAVSGKIRDVLDYLESSIVEAAGDVQCDIKEFVTTMEEHVARINRLIDTLTRKGRKIALILDVTNSDWSCYLKPILLHQQNNRGVKFILSAENNVLSDNMITPEHNAGLYNIFTKHFCRSDFFDLDSKSKRLFIDNYLHRFSKSLPYPSLIDDLANSEISAPVMLKCILDDLRKFGNYEALPAHLSELTGLQTPRDLYTYLIEDMVNKYDCPEHPFVKDFFCYIALDNCFTESEIISILDIPKDKLYLFYRFFRAASYLYRIEGQYIVSKIDKMYIFDSYHINIRHRYEDKIVSYFIDNYKKHLNSIFFHLTRAPKRSLQRYYDVFRGNILQGILPDELLLVCESVLASYDTPDDSEFEANNYLRIITLCRIEQAYGSAKFTSTHYDLMVHWLTQGASATCKNFERYAACEQGRAIEAIRAESADEELARRCINEYAKSELNKISHQIGTIVKRFVAGNKELLYEASLLYADFICAVSFLFPEDDREYLNVLERLYLLHIDTENSYLIDDLCAVLASRYYYFTANDLFKDKMALWRREVDVPLPLVKDVCVYDQRPSLFANGCFIAKKEGLYALLDRDEKEIVPFIYTYMKRVALSAKGTTDSNCYSCSIDGKHGVIDSLGKIVLPLMYEGEVKELVRDYYVVGQQGKYGVVDKANNIVVPALYDRVYAGFELPNADAQALVSIARKYGYIQPRNGEMIPCLYDDLDFQFLDRPLLAARKDGLWGVIDCNNRIVLPFEYSQISVAKNNWFYLKKGDKKGIASKEGRVVVAPTNEYLAIYPNDNYVMAVNRDNTVRLLSVHDGVIISPCDFDANTPLHICDPSDKLEVYRDGQRLSLIVRDNSCDII